MPNASKLRAWHVVRVLPHDASHFTQGLELVGDRLIESIGRYAQSALLLEEFPGGAVLRGRRLAPEEFAEGATMLDGRIYQLTWREHVVHVYDAELNEQVTLRNVTEGWGLTHDAHGLIDSDGSSHLRFRDPLSFTVRREIQVHDGSTSVERLNELEYARGAIYANVWLTDRVAEIDPASGAVRAWIDFTGLKDRFAKPAGWIETEHVLNGIAFDPRSGHFYVTGKCWPALFEVAIEP